MSAARLSATEGQVLAVLREDSGGQMAASRTIPVALLAARAKRSGAFVIPAMHSLAARGLLRFRASLDDGISYQYELLPEPQPGRRPATPAHTPTEGIMGRVECDGPCVYLLKCRNLYKIGLSRNVRQRVESIATSVPYEVALIHTIATDRLRETESHWHKVFGSRRVRGEWFRLSRRDVRHFINGNGAAPSGADDPGTRG